MGRSFRVCRVGKFRVAIPAADLFRERVYWLNLFKMCPGLGPPDMCLITSRNVKQTSTSTKTAKPSTNCNEPLRICFLPGKARAGQRGKDRTPEGDRSPSSFPEASLLCQPNRLMGCSGSPLWRTSHPWRGVPAQGPMHEPRLAT